jgi:hypothetical protein
MICELCRLVEATIFINNKHGTLNVCKECQHELLGSLGFYIAGNEVVKEEFDERTK